MQINRLFEIIYILMRKKKVTAKELAERFEVSTRTIYRDIEILSSSNIPIYMSKGKGGGIHMLDNFILDKSMFTEDEQNEILTAILSIKETKQFENEVIVDKLSTIFNKRAHSWIKIDFSSWDGYEKKFDDIKNSILNRDVIEIEYLNRLGEKGKRKIWPIQLWFKEKTWYLRAFCLLKKDYRLFRVSRIKNLNITNEKFDLINIEDCEKATQNINSDQKILKIVLKIDKSQEYRVYDEFETFEKDNDGNFLVYFFSVEDMWIYGYILTYGEYAEVISPIEVKNHIKSKIEKMKKKYF